ncbi:MAG: cryptochrome/photolyase family protein [Candidatus Limnocylindrus sp.]
MDKAPHLVILGDQLTDQVGPLRALIDGESQFARPVLVIEVTGVRRAKRHIQAVAMQIAALRSFADELNARGVETEVVAAETLQSALTELLARRRPEGITLMDPAQPQERAEVEAWGRASGLPFTISENALWLTTRDEWAAFRTGRKELRMEFWYRRVRGARGWLMEEGDATKPLGGTWNLDQENREPLAVGTTVPQPPKRTAPTIVADVLRELQSEGHELFGSAEEFRWPVTRSDALDELEDFCRHRLANFGPFEDAMSREHDHLFHSLLSPAMNLGLLTPEEVCARALQEYANRTNEIPLSSIEGFIRQILGWREFMHHAYVDFWREWESDNGLEASHKLPEFYWSGETRMACVSRVVQKLHRSGHAHHIERLMVLGNFALLFGVNPQAVDSWFLETFIDALPWVVTPNVVAMSQFADLGRITSKPYISGGAYISRMGDDCTSCHYTPKESTGDRACPITTLYWDFIDRHSERFARNPRMATQVRAWAGRAEPVRQEIRARAREIRKLVERGEL